MKILRRIRGPRLGTKIMLLGLTLLVLPWFSYRQLLEMERLLIQGQSQAQLLTAEGISTLFNGRSDLFDDLPVNFEDYEALFAHPLENPVRLDGIRDDWGERLEEKQRLFGSEVGTEDGDFYLLLGERGGQLHIYMKIHDPEPVYRDLNYLRLDQADHVRLSFIQADGDDGRIALTIPEPGPVTAYQMDPDWRFAEQGKPESTVQGYVRREDNDYEFEFRLPLSLLGSRRYFGLSFVDVDDSTDRIVRAITQTLPKAGKESFNLVILRSPEVLKIIQGLGYSGARILVIDSQQRVRAEAGNFSLNVSEPVEGPWYQQLRIGLGILRPWLHRLTTGESWTPLDRATSVSEAEANQIIAGSLQGEPLALRRAIGPDQEIIMAAHPIVSKDAIIGTVVVEQNIDDILTFQRAALEQVIFWSLLILFAVFLALLTFAARLAWRIRSLRREATAAIDEYGRIRTSELQREIEAGDEIGDLARSVSNMLDKLQQHTTFLENMPRTLRHEINNPLNALSTSLQNLADENPQIQESKYLASAKRGVNRIGAIVQHLADAANLEESLKAEEMELVDIQELLKNYIANCRNNHPSVEFVYRGTSDPVKANVSDFRIEQLLDKIMDNAIDFHRTNSPIKLQLDTYRDYLQITVANRGPVLPDDAEKSLFDSMVSHRGPQNRLHFGLGLYVVRIIAEHHRGFVNAMNLADGSGVAIIVRLPLAHALDANTGSRFDRAVRHQSVNGG